VQHVEALSDLAWKCWRKRSATSLSSSTVKC
jgi:hypothetical protein